MTRWSKCLDDIQLRFGLGFASREGSTGQSAWTASGGTCSGQATRIKSTYVASARRSCPRDWLEACADRSLAERVDAEGLAHVTPCAHEESTLHFVRTT